MRGGVFEWKSDQPSGVRTNFRIPESGSVQEPAIADTPFSLDEAGELLKCNISAAEMRARACLHSDPADSNASWLLGAVLRRQGRLDEAKRVLEPLTAAQPQIRAAWFELGMTYASLGKRDRAESALTRAVDLNWLDEESWYALGDVLVFPGDDRAVDAVTDARLAQAATQLRANHSDIAERILRDVVGENPSDAGALKLFADALIGLDRWGEAGLLLERALEVAPNFIAARFRYVTMRCVHRNIRDLRPHMDELLKSDPQKLLYRALKALMLWWDRDPGSAAAEFETFIDSCGLPGLWLEYARVLRACRSEDAPAAYEKSLQILPAFADAYVALANMKSFRMDETMMEQMHLLLESPALSQEERAKLHYTLGKACEDARRYAESFENYRQCNEILCKPGGAETKNSDLYLHHAKMFFTPAFFQARAGYGCGERGPIFIVGMPRSGSTLVEQILSSHSGVEALGEMAVLQETGRRLAPDRPGPRGGYPYVLEHLEAARISLIGEEYLKATRARQRLGKPYFTDKLPGNYHHTGLIHLVLPNAKIIDARRHPLDCCFSNFKHYFPGLQATSLEDCGHLYANYVELMAHFDRVLPGRVHRVIYEQVIANPEAEVRRLLDYLGLPFEQECLRFHENRRFVTTLSADQVNRPLYASGVGFWRNYEKWLDPLKTALGAVLDAYPDVPQFPPRAPTETVPAPVIPQHGSVFLGLRRISFGATAESPPTSGGQDNPPR